MRLNVIAGSIPLLAGLIIAIMFLFNSQPVVALFSFVCGAIMSAAFFKVLGSLGIEVATGITMLVGFAVVFHSNDFFKPKLQQGYAAVLPRMFDMNTYCPLAAPEIKQIQDYGLKACALQNNRDASGAVTELGKGIHFGPGLTLVDSAAALATDDKPVNHCAQAFKAADRLCPLAFSSMGKEERAALLKAAE